MRQNKEAEQDRQIDDCDAYVPGQQVVEVGKLDRFAFDHIEPRKEAEEASVFESQFWN